VLFRSLDACFQVGLAASPPPGLASAFMPTHLERLEVRRTLPTQLWSHARFEPQGSSGFRATLQMFDDEGHECLEVAGITGRYLEHAPEAGMPTALGEWLYEVEWEARDSTSTSTPVEGAWLIFADGGGIGEALLSQLAESKTPACVVFPGEAYQRVDSTHWRIRVSEPGDMDRLFSELHSEGTAPRKVVYLWSLDTPPGDRPASEIFNAQIRTCGGAVHLIQAVARRPEESPRLWLLTRGAQRLAGDALPPAMAQGALWGLGRVLAEEHPSLWGGLLDLDPGGNPLDLARWLAGQLGLPDGEDQLALRRGQRYVARLARRSSAETAHAVEWRTDGSYLLTGGLGGIGLAAARWMVEQGARHLILMGRTPLPPRGEWARLDPQHPRASQVAAVRALESLGATVHLAAVDVANEAQLSGFLDSYRRDAWPPIRGVLHAAAVVNERPIVDLTVKTFAEDLAPKALGGLLLHQLLADEPLDFFVLFSSGSSVLNSPFTGSYASSNASIDALAHYRRAVGRPAVSINWGMWAEVGLAAQRQRAKGADALSQGMGQFKPEQGLEAMKRLMEEGALQTLVMPMDWPVWSRFHPTSARSPLLTRILQGPAAAPKQTVQLRELLSGVEPGWQRRARLDEYLQQQIGQVLRLSPSRIGTHKPLGSLGLDSLMGLELRNRLEAGTGLSLSATLAWTYPTVAELAVHLASRMDLPLDAAETSPAAPPTPSTPIEETEELSLEEAEELLAGTLAMINQKSSK